MLTIANVTSASAASSYYYSGDYYAVDKEATSWFGDGADKLGLQGDVDKEEFQKILEGVLPNGEIVQNSRNEGTKHAPGIDLTFSAPKSVSVLAEVLDRGEVKDAHHRSVETALQYISDNFLKTRVKNSGKISLEKVKGMIVAQFDHATSRNDDPQYHTHCILANVVQKDDGAWRSGYFKEIFNNKMLLGKIYRYELAGKLQNLGYNISDLKDDLTFELEEVPKEIIKHFSSRSAEIAEAVKNYDYINAKTKANAALMTRTNKGNKEISTLKKEWQAEINNMPEGKALSSSMDSKTPVETKDLNIKKLTQDVILHLSERNSVFGYSDIVNSALKLTFGQASFHELNTGIKKEIIRLEAKEELIERNNKFTTKEALKKDTTILKIYYNGVNTQKMVYGKSSQTKLEKHLSNTNLNSGQKEAVTHLLTSKDTVCAIQGYAGTGKTYMLKTANELLAKKGWKISGLAPTASSAQELEKSIGIETKTLQSFLRKYDGYAEGRGTASGLSKVRAEYSKTILLMDESSLSSSTQMLNFLKISEQLNTRVLLVGDKKQIDSVEAGRPFYQLQKAGMKTAKMTEIVRQEKDELKQVVYATIKSDIGKAFEKLGSNIHALNEVKNLPDNKLRSVEAIATDLYFSDIKKSPSVMVLSTSNDMRERVNDLIRERLGSEGVLKGNKSVLKTLVSKNFTLMQTQYASEFNKGDVVCFNKALSAQNIKKGQYYRVESLDKQKNEIKANLYSSKDTKKEITLKANLLNKGQIEVFKEKKLEIKQGDVLRVRKNNNNHALINGDMMKVTSVLKDTIKVNVGGQDLTLKNDSEILSHVDYYYASTAYSAQSKTVDHVIAIMESKSKHGANQQNFYVEISRAKKSAKLVVDNKERLKEILSENTGESKTALDHSGQSLKNLGIDINNKYNGSVTKMTSIKSLPQKLLKILGISDIVSEIKTENHPEHQLKKL